MPGRAAEPTGCASKYRSNSSRASSRSVWPKSGGLWANRGFAKNNRQLGRSAVRARLEDDRLRVCDGCCPNLLAEAELYRYDTQDDKTGEEPIDEYNHALDALRYLVLAIDSRKLARWTGWLRRNDEAAPPPPPPEPKPKRKWLSIYNEALWTPVGTIWRGD